MRIKRKVAVAMTTAIAIAITAVPASAYYITGWQTNSGWNSLDGCSVYRTLELEYVTAADFLCSRDVGVRAKGTYNVGGTWEFTSITWNSSTASQTGMYNGHVTAMKVYHGTH